MANTTKKFNIGGRQLSLEEIVALATKQIEGNKMVRFMLSADNKYFTLNSYVRGKTEPATKFLSNKTSGSLEMVMNFVSKEMGVTVTYRKRMATSKDGKVYDEYTYSTDSKLKEFVDRCNKLYGELIAFSPKESK